MADKGKEPQASSDQELELEQRLFGGASSDAGSEHREERDVETVKGEADNAVATNPTNPNDDGGSGEKEGEDESVYGDVDGAEDRDGDADGDKEDNDHNRAEPLVDTTSKGERRGRDEASAGAGRTKRSVGGEDSGEKTVSKEKASERVLEARRDFDAALERIKSQGNRRRRAALDATDPMDLDEMASALRRRMETAAARDCDSIEAGQPALAKHRMLPEVLETLTRRHLHETLLDAGILLAIRSWLEPLPNRCLPAVHLRKALLEALRTLPVETDHLRESGLGRIVIFFARRPQETPDIQRLAKDLVSRWSRPMLAGADERLMSRVRMAGRAEEGGEIEGDPRAHDNEDEHVERGGRRELDRPGGEQLQSAAFKEMAGRISDAGLSAHQKKLVMHLQKKGRSKRT